MKAFPSRLEQLQNKSINKYLTWRTYIFSPQAVRQRELHKKRISEVLSEKQEDTNKTINAVEVD